ncbi:MULTISPECIES: hypothetical protein [Mesorhizobium]|uniref:Uncharacterized protein n=1 Tax=Rhizobium loti TaxID=381 RepID=A0AA91F6V6_RHILI|nr:MULTISPECIES: hypothetical protein [Mesorhizobium]KRB29113.1 hypothetical protein ASE05_31000 [Mesorhizobium sp. Root172]OBQ70592.1 hypothetical protein A8145_28330 [Mesorhizobium loti]
MATNNRAKDPYVGLWITTDGHIRHNLFPTVAMTKRAAAEKCIPGCSHDIGYSFTQPGHD